MFSSDEKAVRVAEAKAQAAKALNDTLVSRAEGWIRRAPHRRGCKANTTRIQAQCSCGRHALLLAFMDRTAQP